MFSFAAFTRTLQVNFLFFLDSLEDVKFKFDTRSENVLVSIDDQKMCACVCVCSEVFNQQTEVGFF